MTDPLLHPHLTEAQATRLLLELGPNELPSSAPPSAFHQLKRALREPMVAILISTAGIYTLMGDLREGAMLGLSIIVVVGITFYQERKSETALRALREISSPRALVVRDRQEKRIPARELVPGDWVILREGDRVPADGSLLSAHHLTLDESALTGESFPVRKSASPDATLLSRRALMSTLVLTGQADLRVEQTGIHTEIGKIGKTLEESSPEDMGLWKEIRSMVRFFFWSGSIVCLAIFLVYGLRHGQWLEALLAALATEMALLPEEFSVIATVFTAMGAWRLSKYQVLVRKTSAIERLGAIDVLCVDKTGTLTENRMSVSGLHTDADPWMNPPQDPATLAEKYHPIVEYAVLASHLDLFDPMEKAIRQFAESHDWAKDHLHARWSLVRDYPLSEKLLAMSCVWKDPLRDDFIIASKGAPEAVLDLCHASDELRRQAESGVRAMAAEGLRVLGVAKANFSGSALPADPHDYAFEWIGLIGLRDPLRTEVPASIQRCKDAGIRVIMMTGDYPETARIIAQQAGLPITGPVLTGEDLRHLDGESLRERLIRTSVFARMVPHDKLKIVQALRAQGHVVAMTGDGVNDAPSLHWADVGISMGKRGTDVAREASDIVLLNDDFSSIVAGIERGRIIFQNMKRAMGYIIAVHIPIAGLAILPVLLDLPLILTAMHIVVLELIIDPACSILFENPQTTQPVMSDPPRNIHRPFFSKGDFARSSLEGVVILLSISMTYFFFLRNSHLATPMVQTLGFLQILISNILLIFVRIDLWKNLRSIFRHPLHAGMLLLVGFTLLSMVFVAPVRTFFHLSAIGAHGFSILAGFSMFIFIVLSWIESVDRFKLKKIVSKTR